MLLELNETAVPTPPAEDGEGAELQQLCARGKRAYRERSFKRAVRLYSLALSASQTLGVPVEQQAIIYQNRACANLRRPGAAAFLEAIRDAERAKACCRQTERAQYDLALMMVRNKDRRLQPDFEWYRDQTLGNRTRNDPATKRLTAPAPHTARHATLRPSTSVLPRAALTERPPIARKKPPELTAELMSPPYAQKDYSVPTPTPGTDTSLKDRESRRVAAAQAKEVEYEKAVREYAQRDAASAARIAVAKERDSTLTLSLDDWNGDPLLRSVTPELDILTPAVVRDGLVRQTSQKIYSEMKAQQEGSLMLSAVVAEEVGGQEEEDGC